MLLITPLALVVVVVVPTTSRLQIVTTISIDTQ